MSETTHLKLFKHDNPETNKNLFDITKSLNENWNKIDEYVYNQEATRQENEDIRQINETKRQTNEENRQSQEEIRNSQEEMRQVNEKERKSNETQRETNEQAREEYIEQLKEQVINGEVGNGIESYELIEGNHNAGTFDTYKITFTDGTTKDIQVYNGKDGTGAGDMTKEFYDKNNDGIVEEADHAKTADNATKATSADTSITANEADHSKIADNALKVNNHTVEEDVPLNAQFTDTIYSLPNASKSILGGIKVGTNLSITSDGVLSSKDTTYSNATTTEDGLMSSSDKTKLNGIASGATKNVVENVLTSTSTTNALSSAQGKALNDKIANLTPVALYNNATGTTGTVTLSSSSANFTYLEIFYYKESQYNSVKIYSPNGKSAVLMFLQYVGGDKIFQSAVKKVKISGTTISVDTANSGYGNIEPSRTPTAQENLTYITRVNGYK